MLNDFYLYFYKRYLYNYINKTFNNNIMPTIKI